MTHFALGAMWGTAFGIAGRAGPHGQKAVPGLRCRYTGDVVLNTALGLYEPSSWSKGELVVDVIDKLVRAEATGASAGLLPSHEPVTAEGDDRRLP